MTMTSSRLTETNGFGDEELWENQHGQSCLVKSITTAGDASQMMAKRFRAQGFALNANAKLASTGREVRGRTSSPFRHR